MLLSDKFSNHLQKARKQSKELESLQFKNISLEVCVLLSTSFIAVNGWGFNWPIP